MNRDSRPEPADDRERYLLTTVRVGWAIVLIGLLLSPFSLALLIGATGEVLLATAVQSAIVILIGIAVAAKSRYELRNSQRRREPRSADQDAT